MFDLYKNPSNEYRPIPFWSWNDKLDGETLKRQIIEMQKQGIGGYFMHARGGLKTEYLGEEWFNSIDTCIETGKQLGMHSWIYDEEGWPSGFAGGRVTECGEEFQAKSIRLKEYSVMEEIAEDRVLASFEYDNRMFAVCLKINPFYIDVACKKAVDKFIQETHMKYFEKHGNDFGIHMKGFFTDEPRFVTNGTGDFPWSYSLETAFSEKYGYDILEHIQSLFMPIGNYMKVRYEFWETMNELFVTNFMTNIYDWCIQHNCKLTGHIMMEESLYSQMSSTGGVMPCYEFMHIPGIDWLRRMISDPNTPKQVGSVASQLGKKHVITESFALCGWNVSFEELKWIAEWQFVNGVNLLCQHLQGYTIAGLRKRDYPPSLFVQQVWWDKYYKFNDYISRLGVCLSSGVCQMEVLVIHPIRSAWVVYDGTRNDEMKELDFAFTQISNILSGQHISYHYGDETIIARHGRVFNNQFIIGENSYSTVVLPSSYAINSKTLQLLNQFIDNGGQVIITGRIPEYTNANIKEISELAAKCIKTEICSLHNYIKNKNVNIVANGVEIETIAYQKRNCEYYDILFMVNHNQIDTYNADITILGDYENVSIMNSEEGEITAIEFDKQNGKILLNLTFLPMQSHMILLDKTNKSDKILTTKNCEEILLCNNWKIEKVDLNALTLDYCTYKVDGEEGWSEKTHTIRLMNILLGLKRSCNVQMKFEFEIMDSFSLKDNKEFYVVIEHAQGYEILLNGTKISYCDNGYWKDETFKKVDIKAFIKHGKNELILKKEFYQRQKVYDVIFGENVYETELNKLHYDTELESIYLLGDFAVLSKDKYIKRERSAVETKGNFIITNIPKAFSSNQFTTSGFPFFAGTIEVSQEIDVNNISGKNYKLKLNKPNAQMVEVYVNDIHVKDILWSPHEVFVTTFLREGKNKITLKLYSSNRNLLGPHHHIKGELYNVGPESFTGKWSWVERESESNVNEGMDKSKNYWTDSYCFVNFGFED